MAPSLRAERGQPANVGRTPVANRVHEGHPSLRRGQGRRTQKGAAQENPGREVLSPASYDRAGLGEERSTPRCGRDSPAKLGRRSAGVPSGRPTGLRLRPTLRATGGGRKGEEGGGTRQLGWGGGRPECRQRDQVVRDSNWRSRRQWRKKREKRSETRQLSWGGGRPECRRRDRVVRDSNRRSGRSAEEEEEADEGEEEKETAGEGGRAEIEH